jgi:hypothetical protein
MTEKARKILQQGIPSACRTLGVEEGFQKGFQIGFREVF